jgi:hypothetical protein
LVNLSVAMDDGTGFIFALCTAFIFGMWGVQNAVHCVGNMDNQQTPSRAALHASQLNALVCALSSVAVFALKSAAQQSRGIMELRSK